MQAMPKLLALLCIAPGCLYIPGSAIDARLDTGHARPDSDADTDADSDADGDSDADTDTDTGKDTQSTGGDYTIGAIGLGMIGIAPGSFTMGGGAGDPYGQYTDQEVTLSSGFWMSHTEVTRAQWEGWQTSGWVYYGGESDTCQGDSCPADYLSWEDAAKFLNWLSDQESLAHCYRDDGSTTADEDPYDCTGYRMPTEAEWEYAARAGKDTQFAGGNVSGEVAWTAENAKGMSRDGCTTPIPENLFGLCDMSGNEYEWVNDWMANIGSAAVTDPVGGSGTQRVLRGGSWSSESSASTVAARFGIEPATRYPVAGIRVVRTVPE